MGVWNLKKVLELNSEFVSALMYLSKEHYHILHHALVPSEEKHKPDGTALELTEFVSALMHLSSNRPWQIEK